MVVDTEGYVVDVIKLIGSYLEETGITRGNPADSSGAEYENDVFLISAYDWREDLPEELQLPNFWYKPLNYQVEWYKHCGRGTYANRPIEIDEAYNMLLQCIASVQNTAVIKNSFEPEEDDPNWHVREVPEDE